MDIVFFHSSFFSFLIFNSRYWTSNSSFFKVSSSIFLLGLEQLVRPLLNGSIHEDGDGGGGDSGSRMWGTVSGGPSIILIPLQKMWRLKFCLSVDVTIFGVLWFYDLCKNIFLKIFYFILGMIDINEKSWNMPISINFISFVHTAQVTYFSLYIPFSMNSWYQ